MRSLFSTFPHGWPGFGLLLLRLVVGATVVAQGWGAIAHTTPSLWAWVSGAIAIASGVAVATGSFASPAAAILSLATFGIVCGVIPWSNRNPIQLSVATIFFVSICLAIALLGPGAMSVDARRRGRREIVFPREATADRMSKRVTHNSRRES